MAAPETQARNAIMGMIAAEFTPEAFPVKDDKLHGSRGHEGTEIGVYVERSTAAPRNRLVNEMEVVVQFYGAYDLKVDPTQTVSPATVETYADRFRTAILTRKPDPNTAAVWYFVLDRIDFPDDPTGNKTRFEARLIARGNNGSMLTETGA